MNVEFLSEIKVFMYVKHAKKALVPKEEFESIRNSQMQQKQQQQGQEVQGQWVWHGGVVLILCFVFLEFMGQPSLPDLSGYGFFQHDPRGTI